MSEKSKAKRDAKQEAVMDSLANSVDAVVTSKWNLAKYAMRFAALVEDDYQLRVCLARHIVNYVCESSPLWPSIRVGDFCENLRAGNIDDAIAAIGYDPDECECEEESC